MAVSELDMDIGDPPAGALPSRVIVACTTLPPTTVGWANVRLVRDGALTVSCVSTVLVPYVALIVTSASFAVGFVTTVNVPVVWPAQISTIGGTDATAVLLLFNWIDAPPGGAGVAILTVPCALIPPITLSGVTV